MRRLASLLALAVVGAALAASSAAAETRPSLDDLENELMCPTCKTPLELSDAPAADRIRAFIRVRIAAGDTKGEIKRMLVEEFGEGVLAAPPKRGANLLAWLLPLAAVGAGAAALAAAARRWKRAAQDGQDSEEPLDLDLERRVDEELARYGE